MIDNKTFLANEAYHRHVANQGAVTGNESTVKSRLEAAIEAVIFDKLCNPGTGIFTSLMKFPFT